MPKTKARAKSAIRKYYSDRDASAIEEHAHLLGEVAWAWSDLHLAFGHVFEYIIGIQENALVGGTIWTALASDRAQRDVLTAVLNWGYFQDPRTTKQLLWVLASTNKLAVYRNDMIHTSTSFLHDIDGLRTTPSVFGTPLSRLYRIGDIDTRKLMSSLRDDFIHLSRYAGAVYRIGAKTKPGPSPRRPVLRTLELFQGVSPPKARRKKKAPRRQRAPSRT